MQSRWHRGVSTVRTERKREGEREKEKERGKKNTPTPYSHPPQTH